MYLDAFSLCIAGAALVIFGACAGMYLETQIHRCPLPEKPEMIIKTVFVDKQTRDAKGKFVKAQK